ncbi:MAG TPA: CGNR zinc finger domain-containing protein [Pseudonocardia sp.]|uniref:CGNR zinc finger domain-containing protein n=1 Tax=Pseudonocardia sp. TaxID=60912 RepID=UPI002ED924FB
MSTGPEFRFDGGATWLDLLATRGRSFGARPIEWLTSPARLAEWLARCHLTPSQPPSAADLASARELRETLRSLALATVSGTPAPADAVADAQRWASGASRLRLVDGQLRRESPVTTDEALARIARQALEQLTGAERDQLVSCAEQDCRWVFLDPTGRRRWCPSPACASRGRVRALRARRKAATQS